VARRADVQVVAPALDADLLDDVGVAFDAEVALAADLDDERAGDGQADLADAVGALGAGVGAAVASDRLARDVRAEAAGQEQKAEEREESHEGKELAGRDSASDERRRRKVTEATPSASRRYGCVKPGQSGVPGCIFEDGV